MNKKSILAGGAAAALLLGLITYTLNDTENRDSADASDVNARRALGMGPAGDPSTMQTATRGISYDTLIKDTKLLLQFPRNSFPLHPGAADLIEFHRVELPEAPVYDLKANPARKLPVLCSLRPEKNILPAGSLLKARLSCRTESASKKSLPVSIKNIRLSRRAPRKNGKDAMVGLPTPKTRALKNNSIEITYRPARADWGDLFLSVDYAVKFHNREIEAKAGAQFFSSPVAPARFAGVISDSVEDGSLRMDVQVQVAMAGRYTIEANLFQESGEPVGYTYTETRLKKGTNRVKLVFFGRIFHKKNADGPYVLRGLRGTQHTNIDPAILNQSPEKVAAFLRKDHEPRPERRIIPPHGKDYLTAKYETREFSFKEYDGPDKRERLRMLKTLAANQ